MPSSDNLSFDREVPFQEARKLASEYIPQRSYLVDWIIDLFHELSRVPSPFAYVARVATAERMFESIDTKYALVAERRLRAIIRNLFPYDRVLHDIDPEVAKLMAQSDVERAELKKPSFMPLKDAAVKNASLVQRRYGVLAKSFQTYAQLRVTSLRAEFEELEVPGRMSIIQDFLDPIDHEIQEISQIRKKLFLDYPTADLRSVGEGCVLLEKELKLNPEVVRAEEDGDMKRDLAEHVKNIRGALRTMVIAGKDLLRTIETQFTLNQEKLSELNRMAGAIEEYLDPEMITALQADLKGLQETLDRKFDPRVALPKDVLESVANKQSLFKNGLI